MTAADKARVMHDGRQCGCPNKAVCEATEAALDDKRNRLPPTSYEERVTKHLLAKGAKAERQRIRRAQRDALRTLHGYVEAVAQEGSYLHRVARDLDRATRAPKGKRK